MTEFNKTTGILWPAMRMSLALVLITASILLVAELLGFTPQESKFEIESRAKISETLGMQMSVLLPDQDIKKIKKLIHFMVKRNPELLSAGIRRDSGNLIYQSAEHTELWGEYSKETSTSTHILVPILQNNRQWGNVELRFKKIEGESFLGFFNQSIFQLIIFISVIGFVIFLLFMFRTLRQLDPSAVIPERVNAAFDTLAEGVIIIDEKEQILLANRAFTSLSGLSPNSLLGQKASNLNWRSTSAKKISQSFPWTKVLENGKSVIGYHLIYKKSKDSQIKYAINASPIIGEKDKPQGVLITLDDISELEKSNTDLKNVVTQLQKTQFQVQQQNKELSYLATRDPLTGCLNRRSFNEKFEELFAHALSKKEELSCIMVDIDHFKSVNDTYGHATGDEVIKLLAFILENNTRSHDLVGRYGGEEFCLVLPGMSVEVALKTAERIRLRIKEETVQQYKSGPRVTASLGVASIQDQPKSAGELNNFADEALYMAKESGRNQVIRWTQRAGEDKTDTKDTVFEKLSNGEGSVEQLKLRIQQLEDMATSFSSELEYNQNYDPLTGLPNQILFYDRIHQAIERGYRHDQIAAILVIDIDMFSHINNTLGRSIGDKLLQEFAQRLNHIFRKTDGVSRLTVSRFAGDEFSILLTDLHHKEQITWTIKRLLDEVEKPIEIEGNLIHMTAKVGISMYPTDATSVEELFNHAMTAKKFCKQSNSLLNYQFYDEHMQELSMKHLQLEKELRHAIENNEWKLLYQPKFDINADKIIGAEALIRWQHPKRGLLSPYEFIDFAEQRKLIIPIGDWVIRESCHQIRTILDQGIKDFKIAINLSAVQLLQSNIVDKIINALEEFDVPPRLFEIEITETAIIDNIQHASETLNRLSSRNIDIAIDDFGTGYSSLNYLKNLPINSLKIDRSFIKDVCVDNNDEQIVKTLISMAHSLDLNIIAEGVEDKDQLNLLNQYNCDEIQGYLLSKPVDANELLEIIKNPHQNNIQAKSDYKAQA